MKHAGRKRVLLLRSLARLLNACEKAGLHPSLKCDAVLTDAGYVLLVKGKWAARPMKKL